LRRKKGDGVHVGAVKKHRVSQGEQQGGKVKNSDGAGRGGRKKDKKGNGNKRPRTREGNSASAGKNLWSS